MIQQLDQLRADAMSPLIKILFVTVCLCLTCFAVPASAAYGILASGPNCKTVEYSSVPSLWLGHFSGGAVRRDPISRSDYIIWHDDHACFASWRDCQSWQRDMRCLFNHVQGYRTCLIIR